MSGGHTLVKGNNAHTFFAKGGIKTPFVTLFDGEL